MAEPRGTVVGKLIYLITGDESALATSMDKARKNVKVFGQELDRIGSRMSTMVTLPLVAAGVAALKFATEMETSQETAIKFQAAMNDLKAAAASLVSEFLPAIRGLLDWVSRTAKAVSQWDDGTKRLVLTLAGLAAAAGPVMKIMGSLLTVISANPYVLLAAAIVTVTVALAAWAIESNRAKHESENLAKELKATNKLLDDQSIALAYERKTRALLREQEIKPALELRQQELDKVRAQIQAERDLAARGGDVRARAGIIGQLIQKEASLSVTVRDLSAELQTQQTIYTEADRLTREVIDRRKEEKATTDGVTAAIREKDLVQREEITAEEDAALSSRTLAEMALERSSAEAWAVEQQKRALEDLRRSYEETAQGIFDTTGPIFMAIGQSIVDSADGWKAFKEAAKDAIASAIVAQARLWALQGAAAFIPGFGFNPAKGVGLLALSAAAMVGAGIVRALAAGGQFTTNGPTLILAGDNPGGRETVSAMPESSPNIAGPSDMLHVTVNLDGRPIADFVTRGTRRRQILIDAGSVVG